MSDTSSAGLADDGARDTRFSPITDHDKAGILWIASLLAGVYAVLSMMVRVYIKRKCFGHDDWICLVATVVGAGSFIATYIGLSQGLGKIFVRDPIELQGIGRAVFASRITFVLGNALGKASVVLLIKRLFSQDMVAHLRLCNIVLLTVAFWTLGAIVGVLVNCTPQDLVISGSPSCSRQFLRWEFIGIFDAITEALIVLLSCGLVYRLQMRFELKVRVILAFLFRAPLVVVSALHIHYVHTIPLEDVNLYIIPALTVEAIQLGYNLVSATIPNLKSFIMSFDTAMMMDLHGYRVEPLHSRTPSHSAFGWRSGGSSRPSRRLQYSDASTRDELIGRLRPERLEYRADAHHLSDAEAEIDHLPSSSQRQSQERSIRMDLQWKVEEEFERKTTPPLPPSLVAKEKSEHL